MHFAERHYLGRTIVTEVIVQLTVKWVKIGCSLLSTLLANPDGVKYLASEDEFLPQLFKGFSQLDPVGVPNRQLNNLLKYQAANSTDRRGNRFLEEKDRRNAHLRLLGDVGDT